MIPQYVFIVGSFRSGTTLVRKILEGSDQISICPETHLFGHFISPGYLKRIKDSGDLSVDANVHRAVDSMYGFNRGYWRWLAKNVDRTSFTQRLLQTDRSERALFDLLMELYANGKPVLGEKTPGHLFYVPTLLQWFPSAKIIHTLRDPRAIFVSELKKKEQPRSAAPRHRRMKRMRLLFVSYILLQVTLTWLRAAYLHKRYRKRYPDRYVLIKFEDLIGDPEHQLKLLSSFLDIELSPKTLEGVISNSSFADRHGKSGIDPEAAYRWQAQIKPWTNRWFLFWGRKYLREFGYI